MWRTRFASDPAAVGRTLRLGNVIYTIGGGQSIHSIGLLAAVEPAQRRLRVEPTEALREQ